ncbi:MAG TPA: hypothetical protein VNA20_09540 [Frankiaceae bacterium]|nr:hypothetical protein [Frankiaceae bacterium]
MRGRDVAGSVVAALAPFVLLAAFTWTKDGRALGFVALLGGGDLLPSTALLCAHSASAVVRRRVLTPARHALIWAHWTVFALTCVVFAVPTTAATGYEGRVAFASAVTFTVALLLVTADLAITAREPPLPDGGRSAGSA